MKLHSDIITVDDLRECAIIARRTHHVDIQVGEEVATGSRKRRAGVSFRGYALSGRYATNSGIHGTDAPRAATWSAWGYLIAELFKRDPHAIIGTYTDVETFVSECRETHKRIEQHHPSDLPRYEIGFLQLLPETVR